MKLALAIIGTVLVAAPTKFGSEAIHLDNWRSNFEPGFKQTEISDMTVPDASLIKVALNPVPPDLIADSLAALRLPEGPPPPPPDVSEEALCHTLASAALAHGIPTGFFARLIWQESKFKQRVVSHAGAQGVAQFMPAVAAERGLRNPFDALDALPHSARFLKEHLEAFGNLGLAAAAYNGGARRVTDWLARRGRLPQETRNYVKSITGQDPERWTEENQVELAVNLPSRAPCEGVADLSRDAEPAKVAVQLEPPVAKIVETARIAAAKAAAAAKARLAAAKAKRQKLLAKGRGGKAKPAAAKVAAKPAVKPNLPAKIAERAPAARSGKGGKRLAETSAAKR
ncbi:MAG: lytic transglycosylase domain-containing protein [Pseudorhodoplanes sp.]|uniref:lytic transglycosylase domain-containing protein n=1 Tax=Pseudorhodoplanes sp. TaxID=1934341 RepID=UPI003D0B7157